MRQINQAQEDSVYHSFKLVQALQDADADTETIDEAEKLQSKIENEFGK